MTLLRGILIILMLAVFHVPVTQGQSTPPKAGKTQLVPATVSQPDNVRPMTVSSGPNIYERVLSSVADLMTVFASGIAIYIFLFKKTEIKAVIRTITSFANQNTMAELRQKLEQLNSLRASEPADADEIKSIFYDICGQIDGNPKLRPEFGELSKKIRDACNGRKVMSEPTKRTLVSELRERLRHLDVSEFSAPFED